MKFTTVLAAFLLSNILIIEFLQSFSQLKKLGMRRDELRRAVLCERFVSSSFRRTCAGECFESFLDWQKTCKAMWKLDYIDFFEAESGGKIFRGEWICGDEKYEVYGRKVD